MKKYTLYLILISLFFFSAGYLKAAPEIKTAKNISVTASTAKETSVYLDNGYKAISNPQPVQGPGLLSTTINLIISLLFVIGIIYLVMIALKVFYVRAAIPLKSEGIVKIIAKEYIDTKKTVYLIEVAERVLILGGTDDNISLLSEITDKDAIEKIKQGASEYLAKYQIKADAKFADELKDAYAKQGKKLVDGGNDIISRIKDKLKKGDGK